MTMPKPCLRAVFLILLVAAPLAGATSATFDATREDVRDFVRRMHEEHGFDAGRIAETLRSATRQESILEAISRPAEKSKPWFEYREIFVNETRIAAGAAFLREHAAELERVAASSGVPAEMIVAIIGVETNYGRLTGRYRVLDALSTLAFEYPPRSEFFTRELENFFLLGREEDVDLLSVQGSYAGAMGAAQFMPSSYRLFASDGNGDGKRDLWGEWPDVFASVANYFIAHGWRPGEPAAVPAQVDEATAANLARTILTPSYRLGFLRNQGVRFATSLGDEDIGGLVPYDLAEGREYWVGFRNFYVITRYNRSRMYALSVLQLAQAIAERARTDVRADD
jgi:membrane-bound lytic murein transglycosylase B